jgi:hypothetical protein
MQQLNRPEDFRNKKYKVIAEYPGTHYCIECLLEYRDKYNNYAMVMSRYGGTPSFGPWPEMGISEPWRYPHLFTEI